MVSCRKLKQHSCIQEKASCKDHSDVKLVEFYSGFLRLLHIHVLLYC